MSHHGVCVCVRACVVRVCVVCACCMCACVVCVCGCVCVLLTTSLTHRLIPAEGGPLPWASNAPPSLTLPLSHTSVRGEGESNTDSHTRTHSLTHSHTLTHSLSLTQSIPEYYAEPEGGEGGGEGGGGEGEGEGEGEGAATLIHSLPHSHTHPLTHDTLDMSSDAIYRSTDLTESGSMSGRSVSEEGGGGSMHVESRDPGALVRVCGRVCVCVCVCLSVWVCECAYVWMRLVCVWYVRVCVCV